MDPEKGLWFEASLGSSARLVSKAKPTPNLCFLEMGNVWLRSLLLFCFLCPLLTPCSDKGGSAEFGPHSQDPPGHIPEGTEKSKGQGALAWEELFPLLQMDTQDSSLSPQLLRSGLACLRGAEGGATALCMLCKSS